MDILSRAKEALESVMGKEQKEFDAPGPGTVGPSVDTKVPGELVTLSFTPEFIGAMWKEVDQAMQRVTARESQWNDLLKAYLPSYKKGPQDVKTNAHFRNVHTKLGSLFYRSPDLTLTPKDPSPAQNQIPNPNFNPEDPQSPQFLSMEDIISVKQAVLQQTLGRNGVKAERLMDELIIDTEAWAGFGASKLGYRCITKNVPKPKMGPPQQPGAILGLSPEMMPPVPQTGPDGNPLMEDVPVPVFEEWYWRRFSPLKLLFDSSCRSVRFDEDATWMGMIFFMTPEKAEKAFGVESGELAKGTEDDRAFQYDADAKAKPSGLVMGIEIFLKASFFTDEVDPQVINQLILLKGIQDKPVVWRMSPDQTIGEDGKLTQDSLLGFPIQVLTIRDSPDSSYPDSDAAFTDPIVKELNTWRRQQVMLRDAAIGKYLIDGSAFEENELNLVRNGEVGQTVVVKEGMLKEMGAKGIIDTTAQIRSTADDYRGQDIFKQDMDETLGISATQAGTPTNTVRTATEVASFGANSTARNDKERSRVVDFYLDGARKIDTLLMRYATQQQYVQVVGEEGANRMMMWNNAVIAGRYLYDITPDSQMSPDNAQMFEQDMRMYNLTAPDPLVNRAYVLRRMYRRRGYDPSKVVLSPQQQMVQPAHGGQAAAGDAVNKHQQAMSGGKENAPGAENQQDNTTAM